jgi:hypothetical protein
MRCSVNAKPRPETRDPRSDWITTEGRGDHRRTRRGAVLETQRLIVVATTWVVFVAAGGARWWVVHLAEGEVIISGSGTDAEWMIDPQSGAPQAPGQSELRRRKQIGETWGNGKGERSTGEVGCPTQWITQGRLSLFLFPSSLCRGH